MSRITMVLAFGAGYVVGARAGRERYRQIRDRARAVWESDPVQEQAARAQEATRAGASRAGEAARTQLSRAQDVAKEKLPPRLGGRDATGDEGAPSPAVEAVPPPGSAGGESRAPAGA